MLARVRASFDRQGMMSTIGISSLRLLSTFTRYGRVVWHDEMQLVVLPR